MTDKTFGLTLTSKFVRVENDQFVWNCKLTNSDGVFETSWSAGFAHCKRYGAGDDDAQLPRLKNRRLPRIPMDRRLARVFKPFGELVVYDLEGFVVPTAPTFQQLLESLRLDATCGERSFEDFCSDLGYDNDSRKAEVIWKACLQIRASLEQLLGEAFEAFMAVEDNE